MTYQLTSILAVFALSTAACASQPTAPSRTPAPPVEEDDVHFVLPLEHREVEFVFESDVEEDYEGGVDDDTPWMDDNHIRLGGNVAVEDQHLEAAPERKPAAQ